MTYLLLLKNNYIIKVSVSLIIRDIWTKKHGMKQRIPMDSNLWLFWSMYELVYKENILLYIQCWKKKDVKTWQNSRFQVSNKLKADERWINRIYKWQSLIV